jgi:hypothetical protein
VTCTNARVSGVRSWGYNDLHGVCARAIFHCPLAGIKETLVLRSPDAPSSWTFPLVLSGLTPRLTGTGTVELLDTAGTAVAWFPHGHMQDSNVDPHSGSPAESTGVTFRLETQDGMPVLRVDADQAWLHDPARVYPVRVDPTTTTGTTGLRYSE